MDFVKSLRHALAGLRNILRSERNARIHLMVALLVLVAAWVLDVSNEGFAAIFFAILLVFLAEIMNTTIEKTLDLIDTKQRPEIKLIKDMAAGAVLVAALGAFIIGIAVFRVYVLEYLWRLG